MADDEHAEDEEEEEEAAREGAPAPPGGQGGGGSRRPEKDAMKVFIGGLPYATPKAEVRAHLEEACGEIDWLHMPRDAQGRSRGIAFASFWDKESLQKALELDGTEFEGRALKVNMSTDKPPKGADKTAKGAAPASDGAVKRKAEASKPANELEVFVGSIPFSCTEEVLRKDFSECGKIEKMSLLTGSDGQFKGVAFITYAAVEGVEKALEFNGTKYGKCTLAVRRSSEKPEKREAATATAGAAKAKKKKAKKTGQKRQSAAEPPPKEYEVIIKGLPFSTKEATLKEKLADCGDIESVRLPVNKRGRALGFAFVAFQAKKGLKRALKLNGSDLGGGPVTVEQTVEREAPAGADAPAQQKAGKAAPEAGAAEAAPADAPAPAQKKARKAAPEADAAEAAVDAAEGPSQKEKAREEKKRRMEEFSKEEIIARTKANREKAKANREKFKKEKAAAGGGDT